MSEVWRSASLKKTSLIAFNIYIASNTKICLKYLPHQANCCTLMLDELGFKVGFPKRTVNRWCRGVVKLSVVIEAYLQPCICDEKLGHVSRRTIVEEKQV